MRSTPQVFVVVLIFLQSVHAQSPDSNKPQPADPAAYLANIKKELTKTWPHNRTITIACHGHSVPTGYFATPEVRPFDSYPHLAHVEIRKRYPTSVTSVICTGIGGENSEQGAKRFEEDVLAKKPDVITIDYALNDQALGLERARAAWVSMIEKSLAADAKVILLTSTADTHKTDMRDPADPLVQHSQQVRQLAAEYGVGLIDSLAIFLAYEDDGGEITDLMSQSNHPNRAGHELIANELEKWFVSP